MNKEKLRYVSTAVSRQLQGSIAGNLERYLSGSFTDLSAAADWGIGLKIEFDPAPLSELAAEPDNDARCSLLVWKALAHLPPSLAVEGRIWTRLAHVEALDYARARWIKSNTGTAAEDVIRTHFFGDTRTACRDDNAIGRLWWGAYIAYLAMPAQHIDAVNAIWKTADIRSNVVERAWTSSRPKVAAGVLRAIRDRPQISGSEDGFRNFMKALNARGGGILFERMTDQEIDSFISGCIT